MRKKLKFPEITKQQLFNLNVKNYSCLFKYNNSNDIWVIEEFGKYWYTCPSFWKDFVIGNNENYDCILKLIKNGGKELAIDFFKDFKKQILYGEVYYFNKEFEFDETYYNEDNCNFINRYFNEDGNIKISDYIWRILDKDDLFQTN